MEKQIKDDTDTILEQIKPSKQTNGDGIALERYIYKIDGHTFEQKELTILEDMKLIKLFKGSLGGENPDTVLDSFTDIDNLITFLKIVLKGDHDEINHKQLPNSIMGKILEDFFSLNRGMINKLITLGMFLNPSQANEKAK